MPAFDAKKSPTNKFIDVPLAVDAVIYPGNIVALDAAGNANLASDTAGLRVLGVAQALADNTGGLAGDVTVQVERGVFRFINSPDNPVTKAHVNKPGFIQDAYTIRSSGSTHSISVLIVDVDDDGVWIDTAPFASRTPATIVLTSTNGTFAAAADLAAVKVEGEKVGDDVRAIHAALVGIGLIAG